MRSRLTILREPPSPAADPASLALQALGWVLSDSRRADRLLAMTGLAADELRQRLAERETLAAVLDFLCAYEPDLVAAAEHIGIHPADLVAARERLA